jgi:colanic acid biosynthesis glycosyl transferase WcaI
MLVLICELYNINKATIYLKVFNNIVSCLSISTKAMKILLLNQFFRPDTAATGQLLSDVADHLAIEGHEVHVICGSAAYGSTPGAPRQGITMPGTAEPNVKITRLANSAFSRNAAGRIGSYLSFLFGALWHSLRDRPDVVMTLTTPPLLSLIGMAMQIFRGARHVIWEMDVYPDVAVDLGVLKEKGLATKVFGWLADLPRHRADKLIALGECMKTRLLTHGIAEEKIIVAENWSDRDPSGKGGSDAVLPCPEGSLAILYSGNLGMAHDVETIALAMAELNSGAGLNEKVVDGSREMRFVFGGGGSRYQWLQAFCLEHRLGNAVFMPYCDRAELLRRLESGHIGLVTQKNECLGSAVPSKTYGIMAAGRPLLFIGPKEATPARIIERYRCGWQIECNDSQGLVQLLRLLNEHRELIVEAGTRARSAFEAHYSPSVGVARIASILLGAEQPEAEQPVVEQPVVEQRESAVAHSVRN